MTNENTLNRFINAQEKVYPQVLKELKNGKKLTHWMWFIFPQLEGLGYSSTAKYYSIKGINEAREFIQHPVLGKRLLECAGTILKIEGKSADNIFGYPDNLKLRSCITLFSFAEPGQQILKNVLKKYFSGKPDEKTLSLLQKSPK